MTLTTRQGWAFALAITAFFILAGTIGAPTARAADGTYTFTASDFATPGTVSPGDRRLIQSVPVAVDLIGVECLFSVTSTNGESVHVNNYAEIVTNGNSTEVLGTEDGSFAVHVVDSTLVLGPTIDVYNIIGERAVNERPVGTSVDLTIGVTCNTTTTTTTSSSTTSLPSSSTSTTNPVTTTTSSTGSTVPSVTTSTVSPPTTIVIVDEPPGTVTIPPVTSPPTLPYTGPADHLEVLAGLAVAAMASGTVVLYASRSRGRHERG